ncbi:LamG domain-containing protein [Paenibacillus harenae]|uniref:LamG domain-containing protein n=1 Tax=Paenibacillus harenae TaxID=306543 RepID=UPI002792AF9F|nr:LamG domain-containing protein [Paenibacillus harenae]MDQ0060164.1 hypothetical protein [Paenibacillus harenae]
MRGKWGWTACGALIAAVVLAAVLLNARLHKEEGNHAAALYGQSLDSLMLRYSFDEDAADAGDAKDASGHENEGLKTGGSLESDGKFGASYRLGGAGDYVELPTALLGGLEELTLSAWMKADDLRTWQRLFDFGNGQDRYLFLTPMSESGKVKVAIKNGGGEQIIHSTTELELNSWTHIAFTWAGSTGVLYVNGREIARNDELSIKPSDMAGTTSYYIGKSQYDVDPYLSGEIDEVRLYAKALTADEIADQLTSGMTDEEAVAYVSDWLALPSTDRVVEDLNLPKDGPGGTSIMWMTDDEKAVSIEGAVTRPGEGEGDRSVTLTATISKGKAQAAKAVPLLVWEEGVVDYAVTIDASVDQQGAPVSETLYGIFFEDINYAADGGVYAELIENRSFEFADPLWNWALRTEGAGDGLLAVLDSEPLNSNNTHYLTMEINAPAAGDAVAVVNEGFGGLAIEQGATYDLSVYARSGGEAISKLSIVLETEDGKRIG